MITKLSLGKTEETFEYLGEYIPGYNKDRALNGIGLFLHEEDDYVKYAADLGINIAKAKREQLDLKELKRTYNRTFPSDNNKCLTTPHKLYNVIKGTIGEIKKNIMKFCPKNDRRAPGTYSTPTMTMNKSFLCNQTHYIKDLYPNLYPPYVSNVLDLLDEYLKVATENILICQDLIEEEKMTRGNDELLEEIDNECQEQLKATAKAMRLRGLLSVEGITEEDWERKRKEARDIKEMRRSCYHNISTTDYQVRVFQNEIMQGVSNGLTKEEAKIWTEKKDYDFVIRKVRPKIEEMCKKEDLPSQKKPKSDNERIIKPAYIASFMDWCRVSPKNKKSNLFINYLTEKLSCVPLLMPDYKTIMSNYKDIKTNKRKKYQFGDESDF